MWEDTTYAYEDHNEFRQRQSPATHLQHAYRKNNVRILRRITVMLVLMVHDVPVPVIEIAKLRPVSISWQWAFMLHDMDNIATAQRLSPEN